MPGTASPRPPAPTSRGRTKSRRLLQARAQGTCAGGCFWVEIRQDSPTLLCNDAQNTSLHLILTMRGGTKQPRGGILSQQEKTQKG